MIYLDHNATTPIRDEVIEVVQKAQRDFWGNPSSIHSIGASALAELEKARDKFAQYINALPSEVYFTSCGTETNNLAIRGLLSNIKFQDIIISEIEHPSILTLSEKLEEEGYGVQKLKSDSNGIIDITTLESFISEKTALISLMFANNETGVVQNVEQTGIISLKNNIPFHCDAVQALGKVNVDVKKINAATVSFSSHKIYGPKGVGALYLKNGTIINPQFIGGGQEKKVRPGTQNVPGILGFVKATELAIEEMEKEQMRLFELSEYFYGRVVNEIKDIKRNGDAGQRLSQTINICFPGTTAEIIIPILDGEGIAASGGSACSSGSTSPSHVILALGRRKMESLSAIRFSFGRETKRDDLDKTISVLKEAVERIRRLNS